MSDAPAISSNSERSVKYVHDMPYEKRMQGGFANSRSRHVHAADVAAKAAEVLGRACWAVWPLM